MFILQPDTIQLNIYLVSLFHAKLPTCQPLQTFECPRWLLERDSCDEIDIFDSSPMTWEHVAFFG